MSKRTFFGGVHPAQRKELTRDIPFRPCPAGPELVFPFSQHIGKPAKPVAQKGHRVLAGIRARLDEENVPTPFRGAPLVLPSAALMSIAFMGFSGIAD